MFLYSYTSLRCGFISIIGWHFYVLYLNCTVSCSLLKEQRLIYLVLFPGANVFENIFESQHVHPHRR